MEARDIERAVEHLNAALLILRCQTKKSSGRNPEWFRETGHLSDKGIEHINSLFSKGKSSYAVAKEMKMSYRAVHLRNDEWRKKNPVAPPWMRQDGK